MSSIKCEELWWDFYVYGTNENSLRTVKSQVLIFVLCVIFNFILFCRQPIEYQVFRNSVRYFYTFVMLMVLMLVIDCTDLDSYSVCLLKSHFAYIPELYTCWLGKRASIIICLSLLCHIRVANTTVLQKLTAR